MVNDGVGRTNERMNERINPKKREREREREKERKRLPHYVFRFFLLAAIRFPEPFIGWIFSIASLHEPIPNWETRRDRIDSILFIIHQCRHRWLHHQWSERETKEWMRGIAKEEGEREREKGLLVH